MIIDAHYHLEPRMESVERLVAEMDRCGIQRTVLIATLVDPFHIGRVAHAAARAMRGLLQSRFPALGRFLYRTTVTSRGRFSVLGRTYPIYPSPDNDAVAAVVTRHPDRFWGWYCVNPRTQGSVPFDPGTALEPGWVGIKAHPFWHAYPVRLLDDVARWCADHERPLLIHLGDDPRDGESGDYRYLPRRHPRLRVIYAHAGVPHFQALWDDAHNRDQVFVDLSSPYLDEPLRRAAVGALSPARCLYGSDGPYGYPDAQGRYDHGAILAEIHRLPISSSDKDQILGRNFLALAAR